MRYLNHFLNTLNEKISKINKVKILLTGATGFLGKIISDELNKEHEIIKLSRTSADYNVLLDEETVEFKESFDMVIHSAGKAHFSPKTEIENKSFHNVNVIGTKNLLKSLERVGAPREFVFISSVSVYGQDVGIEINEEFPLKASEPYGLSKIEAEKIVIKWCQEHRVVCTILRLPLLVGKNPPGNLGAMLKAIRKGYYFNIDGGKARKSMILAKDVSSFILLSHSTGGIYNLTDGVHPSFTELSYAISNKFFFSLPLKIAKCISRIGDSLGDKAPLNSNKLKKITSDLTFDDSKAREIIGWKSESVLDYLKKEKLL